MNTLTVNNTELTIKEWNGERVVTFSDIDKVHGRVTGTAKRNFLKNKKHMVESKDFYKLSMDEIRPLEKNSKHNFPKGAFVLTKSGYLMIVKSLNDPLAWEIQRQLVNAYFMLEKIVEQKIEEKIQLPSVETKNDMELKLENFLEYQSRLMETEQVKNDEFRKTMMESFSAMAQIIVNQSRMIEQLCGIKPKIEIVEATDVKEVKQVKPVVIEINYDNTAYKVWTKNINSLLYGKDRSKILSDTYYYMNKKYGICWEQEQKDFAEANGRQSKNTMELIFWAESNNSAQRGLFESCLKTILEKNGESETQLVFPVKTTEQIKTLVSYIAEKTGDRSPYNTVIFRKFFRYVDKNSDIKWEKFENKYRRTHDVKANDRVSKIAIMDFCPTVKKICIPAFNEFVKEQYEDIISTL